MLWYREIYLRWLERVVALVLATALSWRTVGMKIRNVIDLADVIDGWLRTGKVTEDSDG